MIIGNGLPITKSVWLLLPIINCCLLKYKESVSSLDWIMAGIVAVGAAIGFMKGAIRQLASIVGLLAGLLLARALFVTAGDRLGEALGTSVTVARVLAFALIGIGVPLFFLVLASFLTRIVEGIQLGGVNRCLGAFVGALKCVLLLSIAIHLMEFIDAEDNLIGQTVKRQSLLYYPIRNSTVFFYPAIKKVSNQLRD